MDIPAPLPIQRSDRSLQVTLLYSGVLLTVVSTLFLMRDISTAPYLMQLMLVITIPAVFYALGFGVYQRLNAPLAAPGIVATGSWLLVVGLAHLYEARFATPFPQYYWFAASLVTAPLITITGWRTQSWLLLPLVPVIQVSLFWSVLRLFNVNVLWWSALSFGVVVMWWMLPTHSLRWQKTFRGAAGMLSLILLFFSWWFQGWADEPQAIRTILSSTWIAGAVSITYLGVMYGAVTLGPLALLMLFGATAFGIPAAWWSPIWLVIAVLTIVYIEWLPKSDEQHPLALEASAALAVLLIGLASVSVELLPYFYGTPINPIVAIVVLLVAGGLMTWLGFRRDITIAAHIGVWLIAAGWSAFYRLGMAGSGAFGLWMALLAAITLLVERLISTGTNRKHKAIVGVSQTVVRWPLADLVIGLSTIILIWVAYHAKVALPQILAQTLLITVAIWLVAGIVYRLPVFIYVALWVMPLPIALLLVITSPLFHNLALLAVLWQVLGIGYLLLGHSMTRSRPAVVAPFFIVGYVLVLVGLAFTVRVTTYVPVSLGLTVLVTSLTSLLIIADHHPIWTAMIARDIKPQSHPFLFDGFHNTFVLLTGWLSAIWVIMLFDLSNVSFSTQGIALAVMSAIWVIMGRVLRRFDGVQGWSVVVAGWFLWVVALLRVIFASPEAVTVLILGLALSAEGYFRWRSALFLVSVALQLMCLSLVLSFALSISPLVMLFGTAYVIALAGLALETRAMWAGRGLFLSSAGYIYYFATLQDHYAVNGVYVLTSMLFVLALIRYQHWIVWLAIFATVHLWAENAIVFSGWHLLTGGLVLWIIAGVLMAVMRPNKSRTLKKELFAPFDLITPPLWVGTGLLLYAPFDQLMLWQFDVTVQSLVVIAIAAGIASRTLHFRRLPYWSITLMGFAAFIRLFLTFFYNDAFASSTLMPGIVTFVPASLAVGLRLFVMNVVHVPRRIYRPMTWWLKPMLGTSIFAWILAFIVSFIVSLTGKFHPVILVTNLLLGCNIWLAYRRTKIQRYRNLTITLVIYSIGQPFIFGDFSSFGSLIEAIFESHRVTVPIASIGILTYAATIKRHTRIFQYISLSLLFVYTAISVIDASLVYQTGYGLLMLVIIIASWRVQLIETTRFVTLVLCGAVLRQLASINIWLIPWVIGIALIIGVLISESQNAKATKPDVTA